MANWERCPTCGYLKCDCMCGRLIPTCMLCGKPFEECSCKG